MFKLLKNLFLLTVSSFFITFKHEPTVLLATLTGVVGGYYVNGGDKGRDFLERYIAISFVMAIRYTVFSMLAGVILGVVTGVDIERNILILNLSIYCLIAFKIITNIKEISKFQDQTND